MYDFSQMTIFDNSNLTVVELGIPDKRTSLDSRIIFRVQLLTVDGVSIYKDSIIVPPSLQKGILTVLRSA